MNATGTILPSATFFARLDMARESQPDKVKIPVLIDELLESSESLRNSLPFLDFDPDTHLWCVFYG